MATPHYLSALFQRELVATLLQYPGAYTRFPSLWDSKHFTDGTHSTIVHAFLKVRLHGEHPNAASLTQTVTGGAQTLTTDMVAVLKEMNYLSEIPITNVNFVLDEYRKFARVGNMTEAIEQSVGLLESGNYTGIADVINRSALAGKPRSCPVNPSSTIRQIWRWKSFPAFYVRDISES